MPSSEGVLSLLHVISPDVSLFSSRAEVVFDMFDGHGNLEEIGRWLVVRRPAFFI